MTVPVIDLAKLKVPRWLGVQLPAERVCVVFDGKLKRARLQIAVPLVTLAGAIAADSAIAAVHLDRPAALPGAHARCGVQRGHLLVECEVDPDAVLSSPLRIAIAMHGGPVVLLEVRARWVTFDVTEPTRARAEHTAADLARLRDYLARQLDEERHKTRPDPLWLRQLEGGLVRAAQRLGFWSRYAADVRSEGSLVLRRTAHPA